MEEQNNRTGEAPKISTRGFQALTSQVQLVSEY